MNKLALIILFFFGIVFCSEAQFGRDRYKDIVDTIIEYKEGTTKRLDFQLTGQKQGLYWDTLFYNYTVRSVPIFVKNNTGKEILITRVPDTDGRFHFFRESDQLVKPGAVCEFSMLPEFSTGPFSKPFHFTYEIDGKPYEFSLPTWGWMVDSAKPVSEKRETSVDVGPVQPKTIVEGNRIITYTKPEGDCPDYVLQTEPGKRIEYFYKDCKLVVVNTEIAFQKRTYLVRDTGVFENGKLITGKREYYPDRLNLSYWIKVTNGKFTDTVFHGNVVNKLDRSGRKTGYWITTGDKCSYAGADWQLLSECDICTQYYFSGSWTKDTVFKYELNGELKSVKFVSKDSVYEIERKFYENGFVMSEFFQHTDRTKYDHFSIAYSKTVRNQPISKYYSDQTHLIYENGLIVEKIGPQFGHGMSMEMPTEFSIPYTIEKGKFKGETIYDGTIEYYDEFQKLVKTKRVVKGKIVP